MYEHLCLGRGRGRY